ncbi:hypothetical protein NFI96_031161, partial [Prochilodus magdalenae]
GPPPTTPSTAVVNVHTHPTPSTTPSTEKTNGRRGGESTKTHQKSQDEVTYSTVVHSRTPGTLPTVSELGEKSEYATIRVASNHRFEDLVIPKCHQWASPYAAPAAASLAVSGVVEEEDIGKECCTLANTNKILNIRAHTGGLVLLPCYCTDLNTKPEEFSWQKHNSYKQEEISSESGQYRNRVQLVNDHSPGNLSLLISHLTEEDGGEYWCFVERREYTFVSLTVEGKTLLGLLLQTEPPQSLPFVPFALVTFILLHIIVAVVYHTKRSKDSVRVRYNTAGAYEVAILE